MYSKSGRIKMRFGEFYALLVAVGVKAFPGQVSSRRSGGGGGGGMEGEFDG